MAPMFLRKWCSFSTWYSFPFATLAQSPFSTNVANVMFSELGRNGWGFLHPSLRSPPIPHIRDSWREHGMTDLFNKNSMWRRSLQVDYSKKEEGVWCLSIDSLKWGQLCSNINGKKSEIMKLEWVEKPSHTCLCSFFLVSWSQLQIKILLKWGS